MDGETLMHNYQFHLLDILPNMVGARGNEEADKLAG
jgi:hypothetical protein